MILSKAQQKAAKTAAAKHLNAFAVVKRVQKSNTPTGKTTSLVVVYNQIPCHVAPVSDTNPTTQSIGGGSQDLMTLRGYAWFPLEWPDARTGQPDMTPVEIQLGDIIETGGQEWRATTDEDPEQDIPTRKRVRIDRPHNGVDA